MRCFTIVASLLPFGITAQHCGYDFAAIIVVRPHVADDTTLIEGLRITLLDSANLPVEGNGPGWYLLRSNKDPEACGRSDHGFQQGEDRCFPFAKDNYIMIVGWQMDMSKYKLLIQDEPPRTAANRDQPYPLARFAQQVVQLTASDSYQLCGRYDAEVYPTRWDEPPYHPVDIILRPL